MIRRRVLRRISIFAGLLVVGTGLALYHIKYQVGQMREQIGRVNQEIVTLTESTHVLQAEWGYLNRPERLKKLSEQYTDLKPIKVVQLASFEDYTGVRAKKDKRIVLAKVEE